MKALKTKTLKISEVLLSISRLFSGPERLPLLKRYVNCNRLRVLSGYEALSLFPFVDKVLLLKILDLSSRLVTILILFCHV